MIAAFWWKATLGCSNSAETGEWREFLLDRDRYYFREVRGFRYDEVKTRCSPRAFAICPTWRRGSKRCAKCAPTKTLSKPLAASFKRIARFRGTGKGAHG